MGVQLQFFDPLLACNDSFSPDQPFWTVLHWKNVRWEYRPPLVRDSRDLRTFLDVECVGLCLVVYVPPVWFVALTEERKELERYALSNAVSDAPRWPHFWLLLRRLVSHGIHQNFTPYTLFMHWIAHNATKSSVNVDIPYRFYTRSTNRHLCNAVLEQISFITFMTKSVKLHIKHALLRASLPTPQYDCNTEYHKQRMGVLRIWGQYCIPCLT